MSLNSLVWIVLLGFRLGVSKSFEMSSDPLVYSVTFMGVVQQLTFERNFWNEAIFLWFPDDGSQEETLVTLSNRVLTQGEFQYALHAWKKKRHEFKYLRLSCYQKEGLLSDSDCVCTKYFRSKNDSIPSNPNEGELNTTWVRSGVTRCNTLPPITRLAFKGFVNVSVLEFEGLSFKSVEPEALRHFRSLQLVRFSTISIAVQGLGLDMLCELPTLSVVQLTNISVIGDTLGDIRDTSVLDNDALYRLLSCSAYANGTMKAAHIHLLDIKFSSIPYLHERLFENVIRAAMVVVLMAENSIRALDAGAFSGLNQVLELDISRNLLTSLESGVFSDLTALKNLRLEFNLLEVIDTDVFSSLTSLQTLNLKGNRIFQINGGFQVLQNLILLILELNRLSTINEALFANCSRLGVLWLSGNRIRSIHSNAFDGMSSLVGLDLANNSLSNETNLKYLFSHSLENLQILGLDMNNLTRILPFTFKADGCNSSLSNLYLSSNKLKYIDKDAFSNHESLEHLDLQHNEIETLHPDTFRTNTRLVRLNVSFNNLQSLPPLPESIEKLHSAYNLIKRLPLFNITLPVLWNLNLEGNDLKAIDRDSFSLLPELRDLVIRNCSLFRISERAFTNNEKLRSIDMSVNNLDLDFSRGHFNHSKYLDTLNFSRNNIGSAENLFLSGFSSVDTIDLSHNPLGRFPDQPKERGPNNPIRVATSRLILVNCSLVSFSELALELTSEIDIIDLSFNNLTELRPFQMSDISNNVNYRVILDNNPIQCSCEMKWLKEAKYASHYKVPYCYRTTSGVREKFKSVPQEDFLCKVTGYCTVELPQCDCYSELSASFPTYLDCSWKQIGIFPRNVQPSMRIIHFEGNALVSVSGDMFPRGLDNVERLYLDDNRIEDIEPHSFAVFPNLLLLSLSGNRLSHLRFGTFSNLAKLKWLYLHGNQVKEIDVHVFSGLRNLRSLTLHSNAIRFLKDDIMEELSSLYRLDSLTLDDNPWSCPCDNGTFKYWIQKHSEVISNPSNISCNGTPIFDIPYDDLLCYDLVQTIILSHYLGVPVISVCVVSVMFLLMFGLVYRYRYLLQVLIYSRFELRRRQTEDDTCLYDAMAIYDSSESGVRRWIKDDLLPRFEPKFRFFIPDRDMLPGSAQSSAIAENIGLSRRTLILLSRGAEERQEILFAFEEAHKRVRVRRSYHRLLIVLHDNLDRKSLLRNESLDSGVKAYLRAGQFLCTQDRLFWEKMNFFLPSQKPLRREVSSITSENILLSTA